MDLIFLVLPHHVRDPMCGPCSCSAITVTRQLCINSEHLIFCTGALVISLRTSLDAKNLLVLAFMKSNSSQPRSGEKQFISVVVTEPSAEDKNMEDEHRTNARSCVTKV